MTTFETLSKKADDLRDASARCQKQGRFFTAAMWEHKRAQIIDKINGLTIAEAEYGQS